MLCGPTVNLGLVLNWKFKERWAEKRFLRSNQRKIGGIPPKPITYSWKPPYTSRFPLWQTYSRNYLPATPSEVFPNLRFRACVEIGRHSMHWPCEISSVVEHFEILHMFVCTIFLAREGFLESANRFCPRQLLWWKCLTMVCGVMMSRYCFLNEVDIISRRTLLTIWKLCCWWEKLNFWVYSTILLRYFVSGVRPVLSCFVGLL